MSTALDSITLALVLTSGGKHQEPFFPPLGSFILMTGNGRRGLLPIVLARVAPHTSWRCGCVARMGNIAGFWFVTVRCMTTRDRSSVGILRGRILMNARKPNRKIG